MKIEKKENIIYKTAKRMWITIVVMIMISAGSILMVGNVAADQSSGDAFGYRWTDSNAPAPTVSYSWVDGTTGGTATGLSDDDNTGFINLGFTFNYYGIDYTQVAICSNGWISFVDDTSTSLGNDPIPDVSSPDGVIAAYWDDLNPGAGGEVHYKSDTTSVPNMFIVTWDAVPHYGTSDYMTFEIILYSSGEILFQYQDASSEAGSSGTVGIEDSTGSDGSQYSYNTASLSDNLAIMFSLGPIGFGPDQSQQGDPGTEVSYTLTVRNHQAITDSFDLTSISVWGWPVNFYDSTGTILLMDTNGDPDGYPDTGDIPSESSLNIVAKVIIPASQSEGGDMATLTATSYNDNTVNNTAILTTYITPAFFEPPHDDYGHDTDGDTYYDYLIVNVIVNVTLAENYIISGDLYDSLSNSIDGHGNFTSLYFGVQIVELRFDGVSIYNNGVDGPYTVELELRDDMWNLLDSETHITDFYLYDEFEPPPASFDPPHSDHGEDTDGDGMFNYLVVEVNIDVSDADTYIIFSDLYDQSGNNWITGLMNFETLETGAQTVQLNFDGEDIYEEGIDGPYLVELDLRDSSWNLIDGDTHTTAAYTYTEFQDAIPPAYITDLTVVNVTRNSVTLNWTAPGDDGYVGTASEYDIRYSTAGQINTNTKFDAATEVTGEPVPQPAGSTETHEVTGLAPSTQYWFAIKAADDVPNWAYVSNSPSGTTIENLAPQISEIKVEGNTSLVVSAGTTVTLTATIDDSATGNSTIGGANYTIGAQNWPGTDMNPSDDSFNTSTEVATIPVDTSGWSEGTYDLYVCGWDEVPNYNSSSTAYATIIIDSTLPLITLILPDNNSVIKPGILINLSVSDQYLNKTFYSINSGSEEVLPPPHEINTSSWTDGNHLIALNASDLAGNFNRVWFNFTIDSISPDITLNSPHNNSMISTKLEINLTISDVNLYHVTYSKNSETAKSLTQPYNINITDWPDGEYTLAVLADDKAGNINEKWFVFTKDTALPDITLNSPANGSSLMEPAILDFDIYDANLNAVSYSINQGSFIDLEEPYDLDATDWEDDEYRITILAIDSAGHQNEKWFIFWIDTLPPSVISTSPVDDAPDVSAEGQVTIEFSESMDCDSVESAISINPYTEYSCVWSNDNKTLTLNLSGPLEYETYYSISVSTKAKDLAGRGLEDQYEFEFTTGAEPKEDDGGEFPVLILLLAIMAIVALVIIVFLVTAKKKKVSGEAIPVQVEAPQTIQVTCSNCSNLLSVNDIGTTMNVTCPFCSTLLTVQSQKAPVQMPQPQAQPQAQMQIQQPTMQIACPACRHAFMVPKTGGPMRVQCPNCGAAGTMNV